MKKRNVLKNDEAVSPVIATILMVAITVVLAATLYMMLPKGGSGNTPVSGSLTYQTDQSTSNKSVFTITLSDPSNPDKSNVDVKLLNTNGNTVSDFGEEDGSGEQYKFIHIVSDSDSKIKGGDRLVVEDLDGGDLSGYEVIVSVDGYQGTFSREIP